MKKLFWPFLAGLANGSFEKWTIADHLPTSGTDCDVIMSELTTLICDTFDDCRIESCSVHKTETTTGETGSLTTGSLTTRSSTTGSSMTGSSTTESFTTGSSMTGSSTTGSPTTESSTITLTEATDTTTASVVSTSSTSTTSTEETHKMLIEASLNTTIMLTNADCETNPYFAECHYCQIESELNEIFKENFNFHPTTEFGAYDGVQINSFTKGEDNMVVHFQLMMESVSNVDILALYDASLSNFTIENYNWIKEGQQCADLCIVTEVHDNDSMMEVTWFIKSSIVTYFDGQDDCSGRVVYSYYLKRMIKEKKQPKS